MIPIGFSVYDVAPKVRNVPVMQTISFRASAMEGLIKIMEPDEAMNAMKRLVRDAFTDNSKVTR